MKSVLVLGMGGVGTLVARLLARQEFRVVGTDRAPPASLPEGVEFTKGDLSDAATLKKLMKGHDAVISCLPFHLTLGAALAAHEVGVHYFDPTEDVATTEAIRNLAKTAKKVMIPQNGLAPGFIGILGAHLAKQFDEGSLRHIKLRVGALPLNPIGSLGYAGNWSLEGLVHEYIAQCDVIESGHRMKVPALHQAEILRIEGIEYEAFTTSGGLGTMTETYNGKVETLNYKSIRYPGHLAGMKLLIEELRFRDDPDALVARLRHALPPDEQDRVLIHASVQGKINGKLMTREVVTDYLHRTIDGKVWTAISWTTSAAIVAVVEMVANGTLPGQGFVAQEAIPLASFLKTQTGSLYAENHAILSDLVKDKA